MGRQAITEAAKRRESPDFHVVRFDDVNISVGVAVRATMQHAAFARLPFGEWSEVLANQAQRGHQAFVIDGTRQIRGFFGYALSSRENAEAWAHGGRHLSNEECLSGDYVILNAWIASDRDVLRLMVYAFRKLARDKEAVYYKRFYRDGSVRASCLRNNRFVAGHIAREESRFAALNGVDACT